MSKLKWTRDIDDEGIFYQAFNVKWEFMIIRYDARVFTLKAWHSLDTLPGLGKVEGRVDYTLHFTRLKAAKAAAERLGK